ncbi:M1 family metallopeptidase [Echinicola marina]|uniref:M1 family metallopeptidase n=1 Tax=Echinicola marina TaxID=2859768 RepID=UPI001CF6B9E8|nr:M1 family metallopeptidase [Echinicola marina]UCS94235.1 M1 family metallopeptidase [Echinicola marina]
MRQFLMIFYLLMISYNALYAQAEGGWSWGGEMDPLQRKFRVQHYSLEIEILPRIEGINASMEMLFDADEDLDTLRLDLVDNFEVLKVETIGQELDFSHQNDLLDVFLKAPSNKVKVFYRGRPPVAENPPWSGGFTWSNDGSGNSWVGLSCQNEGAKVFMPCLDHPSSKASQGVDLYFKVPFPYFVASNGILLNQETSLGYNYFHWASAYPIHNYGINFTMGRFVENAKEYTSLYGRSIPMKVYLLEEHRNMADKLMGVLERSVQTQEKYFGEYPFADDKIAVVETPYLGMEHQTINAYGNEFNFVTVGGNDFDPLLHHELGHEWWGNKMSVRDWGDFWIHEGFCSYGDLLYYLAQEGQVAYQERARLLASGIKNEQPLVLGKNINSDEAYQGDIYTKGAFILHSLRFVLGDELFFPLIKGFIEREEFTYENQVSTSDFIDFVANYSGKDLRGFFDIYLYSTEYPEVKINQKGKNRYDVSLSNIDFALPIEIKTSEGVEKVVLSKSPVRLKSDTPIEVDPNGWYLLEK